MAMLLSLMLKVYLAFFLQIFASSTHIQKDPKNKKTFGQAFPKAGKSTFGNPAVIAFQL